ncbi:MAG: DUF423 domain-containing protein [Pirellulales bacterium]|nr:DUF423 domain-containing protein [Pirellulales bacterium]
MSPRIWMVFGAISAAAAVGLGAYHAHGLKKRLDSQALAAEVVVQKLHDFEVGVRYQMYHALGLILVGVIARQSTQRGMQISGWMFVLGTLLFSGCLYFPVLTGITLHWALVPAGGVALIIGWVAMAVCLTASRSE